MCRYRLVVVQMVLLILLSVIVSADAIHITADATLPYACTQSNKTYILDADITAPGVAIVIAAENVVLDLNGHTVRYGTASQSMDAGIAVYPGYYHIATFPNLPNPSPAGWKIANNTTIKNGSIIQGGTGDSSDCIRTIGSTGITIEDLTLHFAGNNCRGIYLKYPGTPIVIRGVQSTSEVTTIVSRHQGCPQIDVGGYSKGAASPTLTVADNILHGGPHLGIRVAFNPNAAGTETIIPEISGNSILGAQSRYANDYAIQFMGHNGRIQNNTIDCSPDGPTPGFGRGIHITNARNCDVRENTVKVRERSNSEYRPYFAHGIKVEYEGALGVDNNIIHDNDVTVYQYQESDVTNGGYGLNLNDYTSTPVSGKKNSFYQNRVTAIATTTELAYNRDVACVSLLLTAPGTGATFENNTFNTNQHVVLFNTNSSADVVFKNNIINKMSPSYDWLMALFWPVDNGHTGHRFINNIYQNGADASYHFRSSYDKGSDFAIGWFVDVSVKDTNDIPVDAASVTITDAQGSVVYSGTTNSSGILAVCPEVLEKRILHPAYKIVNVVNMTPHTILVSKDGFKTYQNSTNVTSNQALAVRLESTAPNTGYPKVVSAESLNEKSVLVCFDRKLSPSTASQASNYKITPGAYIIKAALQPDEESVMLTTSALTPTKSYVLSCVGITDLYGHAIPSTGAVSNSAGFIAVGPWITIRTYTSPKTPRRGITLTYTIIVTNAGNAISPQTYVKTPLSNNVKYIVGSSTCNGIPITPVVYRNTLVTNVGDIAPRSSVVLIHKVLVKRIM